MSIRKIILFTYCYFKCPIKFFIRRSKIFYTFLKTTFLSGSPYFCKTIDRCPLLYFKVKTDPFLARLYIQIIWYFFSAHTKKKEKLFFYIFLCEPVFISLWHCDVFDLPHRSIGYLPSPSCNFLRSHSHHKLFTSDTLRHYIYIITIWTIFQEKTAWQSV